MLYGAWREDLIGRLKQAIGDVRREAWGEPDLSSNVFRSSVSALAVLYDRAPNVSHDDPAATGLVDLVQHAGLWPLLRQVQRDTLGMREMLLRVDARTQADGSIELVYRPVYPDLVLATPNPECPSEPIEIREARCRKDPETKRPRWTWDIWDIRDPRHPEHRILDTSGNDISHLYGLPTGGLVGDAYPAMGADGLGVIPYGLYHAAQTGSLWNPYELSELVEGSLNCAVHWTFFGHVMRNCSWPQRYMVNVVTGADLEGDVTSRRETMVTDPATVLVLQQTEDGRQPIISQWEPGADPMVMQEATALYERRVAAYAGISPSDVQRVAGDPRSGFAIALNREAQREAQRRFEPVFRPADEHLLAISAVMVNAAIGRSIYPEKGYRVAYQGLPPSPEEQQAERDQIRGLLEMGLLDTVTAYQRLNPGLSRPDAEKALDNIRATNARFGAIARAA